MLTSEQRKIKLNLLRQQVLFTFVVEVLQVSADVDTDVLHFHVLETSKFVHVLQQAIILTDA